MLSHRLLLLLSCLCFVLCVHAQDELSTKIDSIAAIKAVNDKIEGFQQLLLAQDTRQQTENLGALYHHLGTCYREKKEYEKALPLLMKATEIRSKFNNQEAYTKSKFYLSRVYASLKKNEEATALLIEIIDAKGADSVTSFAHRILSRDAKKTGDIQLAMHYLNLGLANTKLSANPKIESNLRSDIINTYAEKYKTIITVNTEDLKAIEEQQKYILLDSLSENNQNVLNNSLAVIYDSFKDYDRSLFFYKKAEKGFIKSKKKYGELLIVNNIGIIYSKQEKYDLATACFQKILKESDDVEQKATAYNSMGYYLNSAIATEKLPYLEKAITTILEKNTTQQFRLPTLEEIKQSEYEQDMLIYLIDLADHYVHAYTQEQSITYLHKAKKAVHLIDQLVSLIRYEIDTEASKLFWIEKGVNTYLLAVEVCYLLNDSASAFYYMEKNKALLLQENIKTFQAKLNLNVPKNLVARDHQLHYKMLALQEASQQHTEDEAWKKTYAETHKEYEQFKDSMQSEYPEYMRTKQEVAITSLHKTRTSVTQKKEAFVEYILNEADGYGIYVDSEKPVFFKISNTPKFQEELQIISSLMTKRLLSDEELITYKKVAHSIFTQLFPFENAVERLKGKKLTVVADQQLQYVPFEILRIQNDGDLAKHYLVNNTEIVYLQSFSLFEQIQKKQNSPAQKLLTIAPQEFKNPQLPNLTGTEKMLQLVKDIDKSVILTKQEASKANFIAKQNDFEIMHFNTHAGLDSLTQKPWISFYEEKMTLAELFGLENQADLVILDACQTNDGINLSGEGVINLSRGFFYNGTQSVMASLWNVNEQAGNELLQTFYRELTQGTTKSKALQIAKKEYLQKHQFSQNTPYYWAAFTLTGSTNAVEFQSTSYTIYILFGIIIIIVFGSYIWLRKR
ncbi:CHAT domain-containing protein [Kordia jejudonensis]|uniref:CHAT domain-containing protein n=1 Tax=Kordia jejudonensis TaxID=1348245 RepID=UPI0006299139|nr:CHAT domain-containing protein [Kordia jejudonensis]